MKEHLLKTTFTITFIHTYGYECDCESLLNNKQSQNNHAVTTITIFYNNSQGRIQDF